MNWNSSCLLLPLLLLASICNCSGWRKSIINILSSSSSQTTDGKEAEITSFSETKRINAEGDTDDDATEWVKIGTDASAEEKEALAKQSANKEAREVNPVCSQRAPIIWNVIDEYRGSVGEQNAGSDKAEIGVGPEDYHLEEEQEGDDYGTGECSEYCNHEGTQSMIRRSKSCPEFRRMKQNRARDFYAPLTSNSFLDENLDPNQALSSSSSTDETSSETKADLVDAMCALLLEEATTRPPEEGTARESDAPMGEDQKKELEISEMLKTLTLSTSPPISPLGTPLQSEEDAPIKTTVNDVPTLEDQMKERCANFGDAEMALCEDINLFKGFDSGATSFGSQQSNAPSHTDRSSEPTNPIYIKDLLESDSQESEEEGTVDNVYHSAGQAQPATGHREDFTRPRANSSDGVTIEVGDLEDMQSDSPSGGNDMHSGISNESSSGVFHDLEQPAAHRSPGIGAIVPYYANPFIPFSRRFARFPPGVFLTPWSPQQQLLYCCIYTKWRQANNPDSDNPN